MAGLRKKSTSPPDRFKHPQYTFAHFTIFMRLFGKIILVMLCTNDRLRNEVSVKNTITAHNKLSSM